MLTTELQIMAASATQDNLSITETTDLLRFPHTAISTVYKEWSTNGKTSSEH